LSRVIPDSLLELVLTLGKDREWNEDLRLGICIMRGAGE
jgi:hypothetical protein